ncbi:MAG: hypothetical protein QOE08_1373 [Thermoleophilaceae bacterium]|nr:hypothetical protein [Thermoleophilaceae bacterium]
MTAVLARRRALIPLAAVLLVAAAVPPLLWLTGWADHRDRTYATRSEEGGRKLDLKFKRDYQYEASFEKCDQQRVADLAVRLGVVADATVVARAYAQQHAPAIRETVFHGCRDAFYGRWHPPSDKPS